MNLVASEPNAQNLCEVSKMNSPSMACNLFVTVFQMSVFSDLFARSVQHRRPPRFVWILQAMSFSSF